MQCGRGGTGGRTWNIMERVYRAPDSSPAEKRTVARTLFAKKPAQRRSVSDVTPRYRSPTYRNPISPFGRSPSCVSGDSIPVTSCIRSTDVFSYVTNAEFQYLQVYWAHVSRPARRVEGVWGVGRPQDGALALEAVELLGGVFAAALQRHVLQRDHDLRCGALPRLHPALLLLD